MQPLSDNPERAPASKVWRKKYECKKGKGKHKLVLTIPKYAVWTDKDFDGTPEEYYAMKRREYDKCKSDNEKNGTRYWCGWTYKLHYYVCSVCGKIILKEL